MTISTTIRSVDFSGNGSTTAFNIGFPWQQDADLVVTLINNSTSAETSWTLGVDYTLSGGDPSGTLTATVAPASGYTLHVERVVAYVQTLDLIDNDGFDAEANEATLDRIVQMIQQVADGGGGGSGGTVTLANVGTGEGVSAGLTGSTYGLKSLKASGTGLSVSDDADSITYALAGVLLAANNLSDVASQQTSLNTLTAVGGATNEHVLTKDTGTGNAIWKVVPTGGAGEANTMSSAGGTHSIVLAKAGVDLPIKGFTAGANVTITPSGTALTIAATGEANDIVSLTSTGLSIVHGTSKSGVNLQTKGIGVGTGLSISSSATDLTLSINQAATLAWTGVHTFTRNATSASPNVQINSLNNGALSGGGGSILLTSDYLGVVDIRKTTAANTESLSTNDGGGIFGTYLQHSISGANGLFNVFGGIRAQVEATSTGTAADFVTFYAGIRNASSVANVGYGFYADAYHANSHASSATYGFVVETFRSNSAGLVCAFVAKPQDGAAGTVDSDVAYLVQAGQTNALQFNTGFGIASGVNTNVAFDAGLAGTIGTAAFRAASNAPFRFSGTTANPIDIVHSSSGARLEMQRGGVKQFWLDMDGTSSYAFGFVSTATNWKSTGINPTPTWTGSIAIQVDGTTVYVPTMSTQSGS